MKHLYYSNFTGFYSVDKIVLMSEQIPVFCIQSIHLRDIGTYLFMSFKFISIVDNAKYYANI